MKMKETRVFGNPPEVEGRLASIADTLRICVDQRLAARYHETLRQCLEDRALLDLLEGALIDGNDAVITFYRGLLADLDHELLGRQEPALDFGYAKTLASWNGKRAIRFNARSIALAEVDAQKALPQPKVSVVIPVYNVEPYLRPCLDSVLAQTLEDMEIICVDDGSTDGGGQIVEWYAQKDARISVYHQENQGLSAARNAGLQHARGRYVYFLDSDDVLEPTALEALYDCARARDADIVYFSGTSFFDEAVAPEERVRYRIRREYPRKADYPEVTDGMRMRVLQKENKAYYPYAWLQMLKTEFLRVNNLAFYEGLLYEDNLFTMEAMLRAGRVACLPDVFYRRRLRPFSIESSRPTYRSVLDMYLIVREEMERLEGMDMPRDVRKAVQERQSGLIKNHVCSMWKQLGRADRALVLASLSRADRALFELFVLPLADAQKKLDSAQKMASEQRDSAAWKVGRIATWIPRKIAGFIRLTKREGLGKAIREARHTLLVLPVNARKLLKGK